MRVVGLKKLRLWSWVPFTLTLSLNEYKGCRFYINLYSTHIPQYAKLNGVIIGIMNYG